MFQDVLFIGCQRFACFRFSSFLLMQEHRVVRQSGFPRKIRQRGGKRRGGHRSVVDSVRIFTQKTTAFFTIHPVMISLAFAHPIAVVAKPGVHRAIVNT